MRKEKAAFPPKEIPVDTFSRLAASIMSNPMVARNMVSDPKIARRVGEGTAGKTVAHLAALSVEGAKQIVMRKDLHDIVDDTGVGALDLAKETLKDELEVMRHA